MLQFNRKELLAAVKAVSKVVDRKVVQPVLASVKITAESVTGTNLDTWITVNVRELSGLPAYTTAEATEVVTPAKKLIEVLTALSTDTVTLKVETSGLDTHVVINGLKLESFPSEDYPRYYPIEVTEGATGGKVAFQIDSEELTRIIDQTAVFAANYDTSSILGGIHFQGNDVCATDGSRLSHTKLSVSSALPFLLPAVVADKALKPLLKKAGNITVKADRDNIEVTAESFTLKSRQIRGEYPRYMELFPQSSSKVIKADKKALLASLKLLKASLDDHTNLFEFFANGDGGNSTDKIALPVELIGEGIDFSCNYNYFVQAIEACVSEKVLIEFNGSLKPLIFLDLASDLKHLLMPVQSERIKKMIKAHSILSGRYCLE